VSRCWVLALGALAIAAPVIAVGCSDDEGGTTQQSGSGASNGGGGEGGSGYVPPACGDLSDAFVDVVCKECAEASCCAELEACSEGSACSALRGCRGVCFDQACVTACEAQHPDGVAPSGAIDGCLQGACAVECPLPVGICGTVFTTGEAECDDCVSGACCPEVTACVADVQCDTCLKTFDEACETDVLYQDVVTCFGGCTGVCDG
jgi:hypothetical protein